MCTELIAGHDDLSAWTQQRLGTFFIAPSVATVPGLQATSVWANNSGYEPAALSTSYR